MDNIWDQNQQDEEYLEEGEEPAGEFSYMENEVVRRIEKAKLYEALLKSQLFDEGSASPEVIAEVQAEFKNFAVERIEVLLGMRQGGEPSSFSQFAPDEVSALKALAGRAIAMKQNSQHQTATAPSQPAPRVNTISASPVVRTAQAKPQQRRPAPQQAPQKQLKTQRTAPKQVRRPKSDNLSQTGQDLSQASNPNAVPMPSNDMANAHIAMQASRSRMANDGGNSGGAEAQLLQLAIGIAQNTNKNVRED